jgi:hypothetical protein
VTFSEDVSSIVLGKLHTLIVTRDGRLFGCGSNNRCQLGLDTAVKKITVLTPLTTGVVQVAAGWEFSLVLKTDGRVWACGRNRDGQLGVGDWNDRDSLVLVKEGGVPMTGVLAVAAGGLHSLFLKTDGRLYSCGYNYYGQLGNGDTINTNSPKLVTTGVAAIAAGGSHTLILKTDNSLWVCGDNHYGQLGLGSGVEHQKTLAQVMGMTEVVTVSGGDSHTHAVKKDGSLWAAGYNAFGQLGDGTTTNRTSFKRITW